MKRHMLIAIAFTLTILVHVRANAHEECPFKTCQPNFIDRPTVNPVEPVIGMNVPMENLMEFMCEHYYTVLNPAACVDGLRECIVTRLSQRIYQPDTTEEERAFNALVQCVVGK